MQRKFKTTLAGLAALVVLSACGGTPVAQVTPTATSQQITAVPTTDFASYCTVVTVLPTPGPTEVSLFPPAGEADWVRGPQAAQVVFTEYSDFQ